MKTNTESHSQIGYDIARAAPDLAYIADWILYHHERFDGTIYSTGLRGKQIPWALVYCR